MRSKLPGPSISWRCVMIFYRGLNERTCRHHRLRQVLRRRLRRYALAGDGHEVSTMRSVPLASASGVKSDLALGCATLSSNPSDDADGTDWYRFSNLIGITRVKYAGCRLS